jgi:transposase
MPGSGSGSGKRVDRETDTAPRLDSTSRLLRLKGVWIKNVRFEPDRVLVEVALRRKRLLCPECGYSTRARKDTRPEDTVWRHLDLGCWRLEVHCRRRRLWCPEHGARTEGVPFARPGSEFGSHAPRGLRIPRST